jgi:bacterioferritin-associated ferredoxin
MPKAILGGTSAYGQPEERRTTMVVLVHSANDTLICHCLGISQSEITHAVDEGSVRSLRDVIHCTGAGSGCTACHRRIRHLIEARRGMHAPGQHSSPAV